MKIYTTDEIADWILSKVNHEAGDTISPLKLQKLLYYCQAYHYTIFKTPLFNEKIEAWSHGPVVYSQFKRFDNLLRTSAIDAKQLELKVPTFTKETEELLDELLEVYGEHSGHYLENLTHNEAPWKDARGNLEPWERCNNEITLDAMSNFYGNYLIDGKGAE